jgi:hypothetical protein
MADKWHLGRHARPKLPRFRVLFCEPFSKLWEPRLKIDKHYFQFPDFAFLKICISASCEDATEKSRDYVLLGSDSAEECLFIVSSLPSGPQSLAIDWFTTISFLSQKGDLFWPDLLLRLILHLLHKTTHHECNSTWISRRSSDWFHGCSLACW